MDKMDKINLLFSFLASKIEEIVKITEAAGVELEPEEIIVAAVEEMLLADFEEVQVDVKNNLIASIDRTKVQFYIGNDMSIQLYEEETIEYEDEDNLL